MRDLDINKSTVYYALYLGMTEQKVGDLYTGTLVSSYAAPVAIRASVSAARGTSEIDLFGINASYTNTVIVDDIECPISETTRLWIGISPDNATPHNYEVTAVARSLNHIAYAVKKVDYSTPSA